MKTLLNLVLAAVFSLTSVAAFANTDGKEKGNSNQEISSSNTPAEPVPAPVPAPSTGGCGCGGKPKAN